VDLRDVAQEVVRTLRDRAPQLRVDLRATEKEVMARADRRRMVQVLGNLVSAAGGKDGLVRDIRVEVDVRQDQVEMRVSEVPGNHHPPEAEKIHLRVVEEDVVETEAAPMKVVPPSAHGAALFIAAELLRLHDGKLDVTILPGRYPEYVATLPRAE
jgi:K+-sensing histidine kinase KdpD